MLSGRASTAPPPFTLGKAAAGLNAQAKGRALGIYRAPPEGGRGEPQRSGLGEDCWIVVCGRPVPAKHTEQGLRAVVKDQPIDPQSVERYLESRFGAALPVVREAMEAVAASYPADELAEAAYELYEQFRPRILPGQSGWGQKGELDLERIRAIVR